MGMSLVHRKETNWRRDPSAIIIPIIILQRGAESEADQDKTRWNQAGCGLWAAGAADLILQASESASVWAECGGTVLTMPAIVKLK